MPRRKNNIDLPAAIKLRDQFYKTHAPLADVLATFKVAPAMVERIIAVGELKDLAVTYTGNDQYVDPAQVFEWLSSKEARKLSKAPKNSTARSKKK